MTFFEYKTTLAKIETSNYSQLRILHSKLSEYPMDNFYIIHAINKTITKFKALTKSTIIKNKDYLTGTRNFHFLKALRYTTSKEDIVSLITDFTGNKNLQLPLASKAIEHISTLLISDDDCSILSKVTLSTNYCAIGTDSLNSNNSLSDQNRLLPSVICYLSNIEGTPVYNYFLNHSIYAAKHYTSTTTSRDILLQRINNQLQMYKDYTKALNKTYTILTNTFDKDTQ